MLRALQGIFDKVEPLGPVNSILISFYMTLMRFINRILKRLCGKRIDYTHSRVLGRLYARYFGKKLAGGAYDLIVAPAASTEISELATSTPICYVSDATFSLVVDYPLYSDLLSFSIAAAHSIERKGIGNSNLILYPSKWAARSAVDEYGAENGSVFVIPFGANIDHTPTREIALGKRRGDICNLLFFGVNWRRKGGQIAFETLVGMLENGVNARLTVCGCIPPCGYSHPNMRTVPFLNKNDADDYSTLISILKETHFLVLPTRTECYGIVFCEASAYGIPSITSETGGVSGVVENGVNGYRLPYEATGKDYARLITEIYGDDERYRALVHSSREKFEKELNWTAWAERVKEICFNHLGQQWSKEPA